MAYNRADDLPVDKYIIKKKQIADLEQGIYEHGHQCHSCETCEGGFKEIRKEVKWLKEEL